MSDFELAFCIYAINKCFHCRLDVKLESGGAGTSGGGGSTVTIAKKPAPPSYQSWQESKGSIKERTSCLVNSDRLSDITFHVGPMDTPIFGNFYPKINPLISRAL